MTTARLTGLIAAPFTPLDSEGRLHLPLIAPMAQSLAENGVQGAFICGTTGEGFSLTTTERLQVTDQWLASAPSALRVIVHVGHNSLGESQQLAAHAQKSGAYAVATLGPSFFRPATVAQLVDFCARIAEAAPELPFYYYHMPAMTGVRLPMLDFLQLAGQKIPNLAGIKFTDENLMEYSQCLRFDNGRYNILFGRDEILLAALALGATGAVGSTYNFMAPLYHQVMQAFEQGDLDSARRHQARAVDIIAIMSRYGGLPAGKAMMKLLGLNCGPVRPPLRNLALEELEALSRELAKAGFPLAGIPPQSAAEATK